MPLQFIHKDITQVHVDAIVNAANSTLLGGGGVDGAIHLAAGKELLEECRKLGGCEVGQAKITKGYKLPAPYIIHTVGPIWQGGNNQEEKLLAECYRNVLTLAKEYQMESVAFPLISSGVYGYPKDKALHVAISIIGDFLLTHEMSIFLVVYDKTAIQLSEKLYASITRYVDDAYIEEYPSDDNDIEEYPSDDNDIEEYPIDDNDIKEYPIDDSVMLDLSVQGTLLNADWEVHTSLKKHKPGLDDIVKGIDETFSQRLLRFIDEKGMTDAETYKKANIDRRLFSKIRNDIHYKPSKPTALALAIALQLNLDETKDLLLKAGYALSHSNKFDLIVEYFIHDGNYNIHEINEALFAFDQNLLGM